MSILIVVAHPDDEVLGCGGTMAALAAKGLDVRAVLLSGKAEARNHRPDLSDFYLDIIKAQEILGVGEPILGDFPNINFNIVPHLHLVQFIEQAIVDSGGTTIFTHHPSDLNNDHLQTTRACLAASRLYQRRNEVPRLKNLFYMEIPSATDWSYPGMGPVFAADSYHCIGMTLEKKLAALRAYRDVMRDFPHPRSDEIIRGLAACRGGEARMQYAEAFQTAFRAMGEDGEW